MLDQTRRSARAFRSTDSLRKKFEEYGATVESVPDEKTVIVRGLTEDAQKKLRDLGYTVEEFPDGSFRVVANTDEAKAALADAIGRLNMWRTRRRSRTSVQTRQSFDTNAAQAGTSSRSSTSPRLLRRSLQILDKLKAGKQITLADLQEIGAKVAEPEVIAKVADALRDVNAVAVAADNAARKRTLVIDVQALSAAESAWHAAGNYGPAPRPLPERDDGGRLRVRGRRPDASTIGRG
ncbi:hypothetical protein GS441_19545 [Rhodococcus hoagii]|uniref:Uncharacterized protein n=1 Tax=Rhodococcus hoagii TaxID=43767 RepID=A0A9Q2PC86_RHOHA|nr:hypothetical protein [Prescottella equi]